MQDLMKRAEILIEALPYIKQFWGKTIVIKYGGSAMKEVSLKESFATDIVLLHYVGIRPVIVHGGGPLINEIMKLLGKTPEFIDGLRVTDSQTMEIVEMVLAGKINKEIVALINQKGARAVGLSGVDGNLFYGEKISEELGFVGELETVNPELILTLDEAGYIPVIAPIAVGKDNHHYNINADLVAGKLANALKAHKLIILTDRGGLLKTVSDENSLIHYLSVKEMEEMVKQNEISQGMLPKLEACKLALADDAVGSAHIIDGRLIHSILLELFTVEGIGTKIVSTR